MIRYTTIGQPFQIDREDLPILKKFSCIRLNSKGYVAVRRPGEKKNYLLHRLVMRAPSGVLVDHRNLDRADARRENLRLCTHAQNNRNFPKSNRPDHTSKFKGVSWHPSHNLWRARIYHESRCIWLGNFECPVRAAEAYDQAATRHHGEFARLNFNYVTPPD